MKNKLITCLLLLAVFITSCTKNKDSGNELTGTLKDYTGKLDGCTWLVDLDNGRRLEVRSIPPGITLTDGKKVAVKFTINNNTVSICMAGEIADISSLRYL